MDSQQNWRSGRRNEGRVILGIVLAGIGILLLLQMFHLLPDIIYSMQFWWPLSLIVIGLAIGVKSNFRRNAWWILVLIGIANFVPSFYIGDVPTRRILWPALLVAAGLAIIFRKHGYNGQKVLDDKWIPDRMHAITNDAPIVTDTVNIDVTFGGRKEIVTSRTFRGGVIRATFSGVELNLAGADSDIQPMVLEVHAAFAGVEIIVPSHWELLNEINPTMGSVEDHRMIRTTDAAAEKRTLILRGSCAFGSVEIKSY
jgi:hypothetical protein